VGYNPLLCAAPESGLRCHNNAEILPFRVRV
jgi:hypothetical protein